jgi:hypothetical protein
MDNVQKHNTWDKKNINHKFKSSAQKNQGRKIVIIGNNHAWGCASNIKRNFKDSYKTSSFVKPGACINTLITSVMGDIEYFGKVQMMLVKIIPKVN